MSQNNYIHVFDSVMRKVYNHKHEHDLSFYEDSCDGKDETNYPPNSQLHQVAVVAVGGLGKCPHMIANDTF